MIKALKNKYALSNQGAKDLLKGIIYSVLANISLMFPVILLAIVLNQLLAPILGMNAPEISAWEAMTAAIVARITSGYSAHCGASL